MKNVIKSIAAATCGVLLLSTNVSASLVGPKAECKNNRCENFRVGMYRISNSLSMNVLLEKSKGDKVVVRLMNDKGNVLHQEVLGKSLEKYGRKFNFEEVADGNYTLEISDDNEKIVKNIRVKTNEVTEIKNRSLFTMN